MHDSATTTPRRRDFSSVNNSCARSESSSPAAGRVLRSRTVMKDSVEHPESGGEHRQRREPDNDLAEPRAWLLLHQHAVARREQNAHQQKRRQQAVDDGGPEQKSHGIDAEEVEADPEADRKDDDGIERQGLAELLVETVR